MSPFLPFPLVGGGGERSDPGEGASLAVEPDPLTGSRTANAMLEPPSPTRGDGKEAGAFLE